MKLDCVENVGEEKGKKEEEFSEAGSKNEVPL